MPITVKTNQHAEQVFELQSCGAKQAHEIHVEKNGTFKGVALLWDMRDCDVSFVIDLDEGAETELYALVAGSARERGSLLVRMNHRGVRSKGRASIKAVLAESAQLRFTGMIQIQKQAQKAQSYLREDVLLLSEHARSWGKPQLEIEANNVCASHGSTVGRMDNKQLQYLASRGISEEQGKKMIVEGFAGSVLEHIKDEKIKDKLLADVNCHLAGAHRPPSAKPGN